MSTRVIGLTALFAYALLGGQALGNPVLSFNEATGGAALNTNSNAGWKFNVLSPITIDGLGWFDDGRDGLFIEHRVGIWNPTGSLLADVLVPAGVAAPLDGQFRTVSIPPLSLAAGNGYIVGGLNSTTNTERLACGNPSISSICFGTMSQTLDPRVNYVAATYSDPSATFTRPALVNPGTTQGFYGPGFSVQVPEPGSYALCMVVAALLMVRRH